MPNNSRASDLFTRLERDGRDAILELVRTRKSEELFLDFKRSANDGATANLHDNDRNNLAKAISGFGNSEGGVIVWGVDCSRDAEGADVARALVPIQSVARFVAALEGAVSGCTVPPHQGVRSIPVQDQDGAGYAVTLVPKSNHAPHQVVGRLQYFIRAGSDFVPTPHGVLAGMFGRSPQPHVFHNYIVGNLVFDGPRIRSQIGFAVANDGPGVASDLYLGVTVESKPTNFVISFDVPDQQSWTGSFAFGRKVDLITKYGVRIGPNAITHALVMNVTVEPPFDEAMTVRGIAGAGNSPPYRFTLTRDRVLADEAYQELQRLNAQGQLSDERRRELQETLLGYDHDGHERDDN